VLLIFGMRRRGYRIANVFAMCGICHSPAAQAVVKVRTFFTFFFIPLIPLGTKYRSTCTMCGGVTELNQAQADQAVATMNQQRAQAQAQAPATTPLQAPQPTAVDSGPAAPPPPPGS
jgi:hypothetical protein